MFAQVQSCHWDPLRPSAASASLGGMGYHQVAPSKLSGAQSARYPIFTGIFFLPPRVFFFPAKFPQTGVPGKQGSKQASKPASKQARQQASKPASKPASQQASQPASKQAREPASKPRKQASQPASKPARQPATVPLYHCTTENIAAVAGRW